MSDARVGLVLGGGGLVGLGYHAAALTALETDIGWDARTADVIVGTSAGSIVASLLRRGVAPMDLASMSVGLEPLRAAGRAALLQDTPVLPPWELRSILRPVRIPDPRLLAGIVRHPHRVDPIGIGMGLLADGRLDGAEHRQRLGQALGERWPAETTWICAVRRHDLRRVVFGRDMTPSLADAVAASCAVPAYFSPVEVGGVPYLDGGVHSPTNAAVVRDLDLDLVVVISPMSTRTTHLLGAQHWVRRYARAKVDREVVMLRRRGITTVVLQPSDGLTKTLGTDFMTAANLPEIVARTYFDVARQLAAPVVRERLAALPRRRRDRGEELSPQRTA